MQINTVRSMFASLILSLFAFLWAPSSLQAQAEDHGIAWSAWGSALHGDIVSGAYAGGYFTFLDGPEPRMSIGIGGRLRTVCIRLDGGIDLEAAGGTVQ